MKGVTTFLITVHKHDVEKLREEITKLGYVYVEEDWTPRRGSSPIRKTKKMVQKLQDKLAWAFCSTSSNQEYLAD